MKGLREAAVSARFPRRTACLLTTLVTLLVPVGALAQSDPRAEFIEPTGFVMADEPVEALVRLSNPQGSGIIITGIHQGMSSISVSPGYTGGATTPSCNGSSCTVTTGSLPLHPGESLVYRQGSLRLPASMPEGRFFDARLELQATNLQGQPVPMNYLYIENDIVRRVTADGTGDMSVFDAIDLGSPVAGMAQGKVQMSVYYPDSISAGTHFSPHVRITNTDSTALVVVDVLMTPPGGTLASAFTLEPCRQRCILRGIDPRAMGSTAITLQPGDTMIRSLGTWFYDSPLLQSGHFTVEQLSVEARDHLGRRSTVRPEGASLTVDVAQQEVAPNPAVLQVPERKALQPADLDTTGDQLLVNDSNTGYDWVILSATVNHTLDEILAETFTGGRFAGFRIASADQVETLLRNHVLASGLQINPPSLVFPVDQSLTESMRSFQTLFAPTGQFFSSHDTVGGRVNNKSLYSPHTDDWRLTLFILAQDYATSDGPFTSQGGGIGRAGRPPESYESSHPELGTWLVRMPHEEVTLPTDMASFAEGVLHLPNVLLNGGHYQVDMELIEPATQRLGVTGLTPLTDTVEAEAVLFEGSSGRVFIPQAALLMPGMEPLYYELELHYIPDSMPYYFNITQLRELP